MTRHIVITGASSGIGEALAVYYAAPHTMISFCGRDSARLQQVAKECEKRGAIAHPHAIDVTDKPAMEQWVLSCDTRHPIDLLIANAGVGLHDNGLEAAEKTFDINMKGLVNTIHPVLPKMTARGYGQIAIVASIAGYRGLPSAPAYSASKGFAKLYGEGLRGRLAPLGVKVNVICPGFVKSRLTDQNKFSMPFLMDAPHAAAIIARGLHKNKGRIAFPWPMAFGIWVLSSLPDCVAGWLTRKMPDKAD